MYISLIQGNVRIMSIVFGTKVRFKELGERMDLCPGCLLATRHVVKSASKSVHLQLVDLTEPREVNRFSECLVCGACLEADKELNVKDTRQVA